MARFQNTDEILSSLYVDFDAVYSRFLAQDQSAGKTFAANPQHWLRWVEGHALRIIYGDGVRRRILKRHCYMGAGHYQEFRPFFLQAGFHVTECPRLNGHAKTNSDLHLVMDCMDALDHSTYFDEFIIFSGDANLTPLLLRIQECARRSLVLATGHTSPAYATACTWRIREDWFVAQALDEGRFEDPENKEDGQGQAGAQFKAPRGTAAALRPDKKEEEPKRKLPAALAGARHARLLEIIRKLVAESGAPVPLPSVAQVIQKEMEPGPDWFGAGTFRQLLDRLGLEPLELSRLSQGFVFDPARHERPKDAGMPESLLQSDPKLHAFALKVHALTDIPVLRPETYDRFFTLLAEELRNKRPSRAVRLRAVANSCEAKGLPISHSQIAFMLNAAWPPGTKSKPEALLSDKEKFRQTFFEHIIHLCHLAQMPLGEREKRLLSKWLNRPA